jgi:hypothetical protein
VQGDSASRPHRTSSQAYKTYPKSRRAPDSLLKLGMALNKMGQKEQACAALNSVGTEFPRAVEAKKKAHRRVQAGWLLTRQMGEAADGVVQAATRSPRS